MAIAVDNLADAESLTEMEKEKEEEKERTKSLRHSKSKSPEGENLQGSRLSVKCVVSECLVDVYIARRFALVQLTATV